MTEKSKSNYNPKADKKWIEKNKEHRNYLSLRGSARNFIRNKSTIDDLDELRGLIEERERVLNEDGSSRQ